MRSLGRGDVAPPDREFPMSFAGIRSYGARAFSGDLSVFGGPSLEEPMAGRVRAEQFNGVLRNTPWILLAMIFNAVVLMASFWPSDRRVNAIAWALFVVMPASVLLFKSLRAQAAPPRQIVSPRAIRITVTNAAVLGGLWALVPILFLDSAPGESKLIIATL